MSDSTVLREAREEKKPALKAAGYQARLDAMYTSSRKPGVDPAASCDAIIAEKRNATALECISL